MKLKTFFGIHVITAIFAVLCALIFPSGPAPLAKVKFSQSMHVSSGDSIFPIRNKVACVEIIHIFNEAKFLEYTDTINWANKTANIYLYASIYDSDLKSGEEYYFYQDEPFHTELVTHKRLYLGENFTQFVNFWWISAFILLIIAYYISENKKKTESKN